jgi:HEAT repeat protein
MEKLLWTFEDVVQFIDHPDQSLRLWALERLLKRFPNQAADPLAAMLEDPYPYIALKAAEFIAKTGDLEYGSLLLNRFQHAHAPYSGYMALALARLDYREAMSQILEHLEVIWQEQTALDANEFLYLVESLGLFGGQQPPPEAVAWNDAPRRCAIPVGDRPTTRVLSPQALWPKKAVVANWLHRQAS